MELYIQLRLISADKLSVDCEKREGRTPDAMFWQAAGRSVYFFPPSALSLLD